jgi:hypothetical protein
MGKVSRRACMDTKFLFWVTDCLKLYWRSCYVRLRDIEWGLWQLIQGLETCLTILSYPAKHIPEAFLCLEQPPCCVNQTHPIIGSTLNYLQEFLI